MNEHFKSALSHVVHGIVVAWVILVLEKAPELLKEPVFSFFAELDLLKSYSKISALLSYSAITVVMFCIIVGGILVIEKLSSVPFIAKFGRDRKLRRFEGLWVQKVGIHARPYSIGLISFDARKQAWKYSGVGFDRDLVAKVKWETYSIRSDAIEHVWYFAGFSRFYDDAKKSRYNVVPILEFQGDEIDWLEGTVADIGADNERKIFSIEIMKKIKGHDALVRMLSSVERIRLYRRARSENAS